MSRWPLSHGLRVADSLCPSGRRSGSGRGPKNVTPLLKGSLAGPWPWTFGGFLWGVSVFLSRWLIFRTGIPAAAARQPASVYVAADTANLRAQQHGSQRLSTRPQSALLCGYAEAFQPSIHNCSRHDLGQPSLQLSFAVAPPRTSTTTRQTPGTEIPIHGCTGQKPVPRRTLLRSTCHWAPSNTMKVCSIKVHISFWEAF